MIINKQDAHIFDVDGTLCNVKGIRHLIMGTVRNFNAFHYASASCPPNAWVADKARRLHRDGVAILVVTARVEKFRRLTSWWLADHDIPSDELEMRADGDYRKDFVVKQEILQRLRLKYHIIGADDDNPAVIALWKHEGIPYTLVPGWDDET